MSAAIILTLAACFVASYCDIRARRIPNWLTGAVALAAVALHAVSGLQAAVVSLAVMIGLTAAGALIYSRGGIGGGDVKLAIATSGTLSYPLFVPFLLYSAIGGGVLAIVFLIFRPDARPSLGRVALIAAGNAGGVTTPRTSLPYALAFAFGAVVVALSQSILPFLRIHL
jgi:prepilin peptidase CpaA